MESRSLFLTVTDFEDLEVFRNYLVEANAATEASSGEVLSKLSQ